MNASAYFSYYTRSKCDSSLLALVVFDWLGFGAQQSLGGSSIGLGCCLDGVCDSVVVRVRWSLVAREHGGFVSHVRAAGAWIPFGCLAVDSSPLPGMCERADGCHVSVCCSPNV